MPEPQAIPSPCKPDDPTGTAPPHAAAVVAKVEGFLSLLLIALFLGFIGSLRHVTGDFLLESVVLLLLYSGSWLFAIGGARRGAGAGRFAAIASLAILEASAALALAVFIHALWDPPPAV